MRASMREVVVSGSLNWDRMVRVEEAPLPGQTVIGSDPIESPGGKGLNQAAAAARTGVQSTRMIGRVGADATGRKLRTSLAGSGVDIVDIRVTKKRSTGEALIVVDRNHQNRIVVSPGANDT